jgi:hypothetical protein
MPACPLNYRKPPETQQRFSWVPSGSPTRVFRGSLYTFLKIFFFFLVKHKKTPLSRKFLLI